MIKLADLQIVSENANELWCFCPRHHDKHRPNFWVTKHNGLGHCFACGYTDEVEGDFKVRLIKDRPNNINWNSLNELYKRQLDNKLVWYLHYKWAVGWKALKRIETGWTSEAWSFPVRNADLQIVGIQRIFLSDNSKRMVNGSRVGILVPGGTNWKSHLWITEGVSDTCVALDLGLNVVGRLSATCGNHILRGLIRGTNVTVLAHNDKVGIKSAEKLKKDLSSAKHCSIIYGGDGCKDLKDLRDLWGKEKVKQWLINTT